MSELVEMTATTLMKMLDSQRFVELVMERYGHMPEADRDLMMAAEAIERIAFEIPSVNPFTPRLMSLALIMRNSVHLRQSRSSPSDAPYTG